MRRSDNDRRYDWAWDAGKVGEDLFRDIITGGEVRVEVKTDYLVSETGNVAIECWCRGLPSGLDASTSHFWLIWLSGDEYADDDKKPEVGVLIRSSRLKRIVKAANLIPKVGGQDNAQRMYLLRLVNLLWPASKLVETNGVLALVMPPDE